MSGGKHAFMVSAAHKSSGKTTVSIGLCAALRARGFAVSPFKKGPDYIDPMWLGHAAQAPCRNLDPYLSGFEPIGRVWQRHAAIADVAVVEGNKGLFDGVALDGSNSNAALAKFLDIPVVLVIDCRGITRGIAPLLLGYRAFDTEVRLAGVILNRVGGKRHEEKLRAVIAEYVKLPVLGAIPESPALSILERHLGLLPANEAENTDERINELAQLVERHVDLDRLLAATVRPVPSDAPRRAEEPSTKPGTVRLGIARDSAFGFYYPDDLDALRAAGAELVPIDTLHDGQLPAIDALFIGGGFPETLAASLENNAGLRLAIRNAIEGGLPTYAECGGLMYLSRSITWQGRRHEMVGVLPGDISMHERPVGRGYVEVEATGDHPWIPAGTRIRAHEFHYSRLDGLPPDLAFGWRMQRGTGVDGSHDGVRLHNLFAAYTHLRTLDPEAGSAAVNWPAAFVAFARGIKAAKKTSVAPDGA